MFREGVHHDILESEKTSHAGIVQSGVRQGGAAVTIVIDQATFHTRGKHTCDSIAIILDIYKDSFHLVYNLDICSMPSLT